MNNSRKSNTSEVCTDQVANTLPATIKLGLDVHADSIVVVRIIDNGAPQPAQRFAPDKFLIWAKSQLNQAKTVYSCYEAGPFGYTLHRQLVELGSRNVVIQPVCLDERHTGVNDDKRDAKELALRLDRFVAGNSHALATVRVPTPEEEQRRAKSRVREQIQREVQRLAAEGRSLLLTQGFREKKGWWWTARWEGLLTKLPTWLADSLEVFRRLLEKLEAELETLTKAIEKAAPAVRPKGMGGLTTEVIDREICDWQRFKNRRQVGSYTGLCGGISSSGASHAQLSITKHGNARLRTALIELAWRLVLWQPQCKLVQRWRRVFANPKATKAARKKAIVAVARQMAVDLWRWRIGKLKPEDFGWVMLGA